MKNYEDIESITMQSIRDWIPGRQHCSDCRHAVVSGDWPRPLVRCEMGQGTRPTIKLAMLLRRNAPGFRAVEKCPDFDSMED